MSRITKSQPVFVFGNDCRLARTVQDAIRHFGVTCVNMPIDEAAALTSDELREVTQSAAVVVAIASADHDEELAHILAALPQTILYFGGDVAVGNWFTPLARLASWTLLGQPALACWTGEVDPTAAIQWLRTTGIELVCRQQSVVVGHVDGKSISVRRTEPLVNDKPSDSMAAFVGALAAMRACGESWSDAVELADACCAIGMEPVAETTVEDVHDGMTVRPRRPFAWPVRTSDVAVGTLATAAALLVAVSVGVGYFA